MNEALPLFNSTYDDGGIATILPVHTMIEAMPLFTSKYIDDRGIATIFQYIR